MPNCRYIVLDCHSTETSEGGRPLVLLLEYTAEDGKKQHKSYLLSDLSLVVGDMPFQVRDWLIAALTEISERQSHSYYGTGQAFPWHSFSNIGPLRTAFSGGFGCGSMSEAFAVIKEHVMFRLSSSPEEAYFPDCLLPLDRSALQLISNRHRGPVN